MEAEGHSQALERDHLTVAAEKKSLPLTQALARSPAQRRIGLEGLVAAQ